MSSKQQQQQHLLQSASQMNQQNRGHPPQSRATGSKIRISLRFHPPIYKRTHQQRNHRQFVNFFQHPKLEEIKQMSVLPWTYKLQFYLGLFIDTFTGKLLHLLETKRISHHNIKNTESICRTIACIVVAAVGTTLPGTTRMTGFNALSVRLASSDVIYVTYVMRVMLHRDN
jgi:hypothetical protein